MFSYLPRLAPVFCVGLVAAVSTVAASDPAKAAELTDVTLDVIVTPTSVDPGDSIRTDVEFCVPDSAEAGDTFALSLADQLTQLPSSITLSDPDGAIVAVASISGVPAVATFELTSYVDERVDVCGTAFFESKLSGSVTANTQQTLSFVLSGGATYDTVVTVGNPDVGVDRTTARKSAVFTDSGDQCRTSLDSCMDWFVESRPGPFASVTITDDGLVDASFECATMSVRLWTLNPDGSRATDVLPGDVGATITEACTADSVDVTVSNVPADVIVRALVTATPSIASVGGDVTFLNVASVTHVAADSTSTTDDVTGRVRSSAAGGQASGVVPPSTTTTTTSPVTTTTSPVTTTTSPVTTTTSPVTTTTTTLVGSGAVTTTTTAAGGGSGTTTTVSPVLPATGQSSGSLAIVAVSFALAGVALVAASRRRPAT